MECLICRGESDHNCLAFCGAVICGACEARSWNRLLMNRAMKFTCRPSACFGKRNYWLFATVTWGMVIGFEAEYCTILGSAACLPFQGSCTVSYAWT